ncbi:MAG: DNA primase [Gammaproteobacteria bacterium]|nr:DNA primase [Gammaproteobacteria bacterium]
MSGKIPREFIDDVLARTDIVELIGARVSLSKGGRDFKACCPFHNEKTPSFTVSPTKQFYHCFGCGANGSAIGFLMEFDHLSFREAIEELARIAGLEMPDTGSQREEDGLIPALLDTLAKANRFFKDQLRSHENAKEAITYLKERGLSGEIAATFELGFAPPGWDALASTARGEDKSLELMSKAGLVASKDAGRFYDRFRSRIIFPIHDYRGQVVAFGGRILGAGEPKYLNSPETPVFQKGSELYNLHRARSPIAKHGHTIVVEGYMDVVALAQNGVDNAVATLGTATTERHLQRLFRLAPSIIFCFDGDRAGRSAAWRALETSLPELAGGRQISFLFLPDGEDPDSLIRKEGGGAFRTRAIEATPLPDFLFSKLAAEIDLSRLDGRARLVELARPLLARIPEGPLRDLMDQRLKDESGVMSLGTTTRSAPRKPQKTNRLATQLGLLRNLHDIAGTNPQIKTAGLLERFRDHADLATLERLAAKDHLLTDGDFKPFFEETLCTLQDQAIGELIDGLVRRATVEELDERAKRQLADLYSERQKLRERSPTP